MGKAASKILAGLSDAAAYARIDAMWRRSKKKHGEGVTQYDWGFKDGVMAARGLFGKTATKKASHRASAR